MGSSGFCFFVCTVVVTKHCGELNEDKRRRMFSRFIAFFFSRTTGTRFSAVIGPGPVCTLITLSEGKEQLDESYQQLHIIRLLHRCMCAMSYPI